MRISIIVLLLFSSCVYNEVIPFCIPDEQTFSEVIKPIVQQNCIQCHDESNGIEPILVNYEDIINAINEHSLENQIISLQMPPYGNEPLSLMEINSITNWINCE